MPSRIHAFCLGWDVGGWHGQCDGLGALFLMDDGSLETSSVTLQCSLKKEILERTLTVKSLSRACGVSDSVGDADRIIIGIDAPFGLPVDFVLAAESFERSKPHGNPKRFIDNTLAFRHTDRTIFERTGKMPLSPSMSALTNNVTKARAGIASLRADEAHVVGVPPFEKDEGDVAIIEVYPALWWRGSSSNRRLRSEVPEAIGKMVSSLLSEKRRDEADSLLCGLTAACYENDRSGIGGALPSPIHPPEITEEIMKEGWIYSTS